MNETTPAASRWVEGRDFVIATTAIRERLQYVLQPETFRLRWLPWEKPGEILARRREIRSLRLMSAGDERPSFPESVYEIEGLQHIGMPIEFAGIDHPASWSDRLESLDLNEREGGSVCLPASARFGQVRDLSCVTSTLGFHQEAFRSLESLQLNISHKRSVEQPICSEGLQHSYFTGLRALDDVRFPAEKSLLSIGIGRSKIEDLVGIGRFANARKVVIKDLPKLTSLAWVSELPNLEVLELMYCPRLDCEEPLLDHPRLRKVLAVSCKQLELKQWKEKEVHLDGTDNSGASPLRV